MAPSSNLDVDTPKPRRRTKEYTEALIAAYGVTPNKLRTDFGILPKLVVSTPTFPI